MAGYSGAPLIQKLGIKPAARLQFVTAPPDFAATLGPLPAGAEQIRGAAKELDLVVLFVKAQAELTKRFATLATRLCRPACCGSRGRKRRRASRRT